MSVRSSVKKRERERERFARNERDRICGFSLLSTLLYRLPIDYNQEVLALLDVDLIIEAFDVISFPPPTPSPSPSHFFAVNSPPSSTCPFDNSLPLVGCGLVVMLYQPPNIDQPVILVAYKTCYYNPPSPL